LEQALQLPAKSEVHWFSEFRLGVVAFNSVVGGRLARGWIGERQFFDLGSQIDEHKNADEYCLLGVLHHHPIPVDIPAWYAKPFYERILGSGYSKTDDLEDADMFLEFANHRRFAAIVHGHKHIPRVSHTPDNIPVFGCGSSVGKVATTSGRPLISINILTFDRSTNQVSGRLLVESVPGGGLKEYHSLMCNFSPPTKPSTSNQPIN
jgi:hypothetical protein